MRRQNRSICEASSSGGKLRRLHRGTIDTPGQIRALLERARRAGVDLKSGVDRKSEPRIAHVVRVDAHLKLSAPNVRASGRPQIYFHFELDGTRYFFASPPVRGGGREPLPQRDHPGPARPLAG